MAVTLVHASISEDNTVNGSRGDQTKKEVCTRSWYSKPWKYYLIHPNERVCNEMANIGVLLADSELVGYSQADRNSLYNEMAKYDFDVAKYLRSGVKTNTDCSAFVTCLAVCAGIDKLQYRGNAPTTATMVNKFVGAGFECYSDTKYLKTDKYIRKGGILLKPGAHVVTCVTSGSLAFGNAVELFPAYKGTSNSITEALKSMGYRYDLEYRKEIGVANNISNVGSTTSNLEMLRRLKNGVLIKP